MAQTISCPKCKKKLNVPPELLGKRIRCSACETVLVINRPASSSSNNSGTRASSPNSNNPSSNKPTAPQRPVASPSPMPSATSSRGTKSPASPSASNRPVNPSPSTVQKSPGPSYSLDAQNAPLSSAFAGALDSIPTTTNPFDGYPPSTNAGLSGYSTDEFDYQTELMNDYSILDTMRPIPAPRGGVSAGMVVKPSSAPASSAAPRFSESLPAASRVDSGVAAGYEPGIPSLSQYGIYLMIFGFIGMILPFFGLEFVRLRHAGPAGGGIVGLIGSLLFAIGFFMRGRFVTGILGAGIPGTFLFVGMVGWMIVLSMPEDDEAVHTTPSGRTVRGPSKTLAPSTRNNAAPTSPFQSASPNRESGLSSQDPSTGGSRIVSPGLPSRSMPNIPSPNLPTAPNMGPPGFGPSNFGPPSIGPQNIGPPNGGPANGGPPGFGPQNMRPPNIPNRPNIPGPNIPGRSSVPGGPGGSFGPPSGFGPNRGGSGSAGGIK